VGGTQSIDVDVRIVVATNRDLQKLAEEKLFREDLYFRISTVPMTIPPLRERGNDVLLLADHFPGKIQPRIWKDWIGIIGRSARRRLLALTDGEEMCANCKNTLERAVILADGLSIRAEGLQLPVSKPDVERLPSGMLAENFQLGRLAGGSHRARRESCGKGFAGKHDARMQVEQDAGGGKSWVCRRRRLLAKLRSAGLEGVTGGG